VSNRVAAVGFGWIVRRRILDVVQESAKVLEGVGVASDDFLTFPDGTPRSPAVGASRRQGDRTHPAVGERACSAKRSVKAPGKAATRQQSRTLQARSVSGKGDVTTFPLPYRSHRGGRSVAPEGCLPLPLQFTKYQQTPKDAEGKLLPVVSSQYRVTYSD